MGKYNFDESCEFTGTTKEDVIKRMEAMHANDIPIRVGKYICFANPLRVKSYKKVTGHDYEDVLEMVIDEFAKGGDETDALRNIYKIYNDTFDENNLESISNTINYIMAAIEDDWHEVETGFYSKANSFEEMLKRDNSDPFAKLAKKKEKGLL